MQKIFFERNFRLRAENKIRSERVQRMERGLEIERHEEITQLSETFAAKIQIFIDD